MRENAADPPGRYRKPLRLATEGRTLRIKSHLVFSHVSDTPRTSVSLSLRTRRIQGGRAGLGRSRVNGTVHRINFSNLLFQ